MSPHEAVSRLLWSPSGARRLPATRALDAALGRLRKGELFQICELDPRGPLYLLPTRELIRALAARIRALGAERVLEVAAGDGFLSAALRQAASGLEIERSARCRLDERPRRTLHSRVTLYYGARHPDHDCEQVRPGDWLWQFRPRSR